MPKLSIIIPTFNSGASIERCLHSIGCQTFSDYEVIVQDGGSADDTLDRVGKVQDVSGGIDIKVFSGKDKGPYDAMNKAIERAAGEWLYFLGSDDELHDSDVLRTVMESDEITNSDVVYGNVRVVGESSWAENGSVYGGSFDLEKLLNRNICHQGIFYRAEFFKQIGAYNINYAVCADWDFNMQCWSKTKFKYLDTVVAKFYADGISSRGADECFRREVAANVLKYFDVSVENPLLNTPAFAGFSDIVKMRESKPSLRRALGRIRKIISTRFNSAVRTSRG